MNMGIKDVFNYVSTDLRDLKQEFKEKVKLIASAQPPAEMEIFHKGEYCNELLVNGPLIIEYSYYTNGWKYEKVNISLIDFLMKVSPKLFLGLASLEKISENRLKLNAFALDRE